MDDIDLHFPLAGVDVSGPVGRQPVRKTYQGKYSKTCAVGQNVRGFDRSGIFRGGIRSGLSKYLSPRPGNVEYITQHLNVVVTTGVAVQPSTQGRRVILVAVSQGKVYHVDAGGTTWTQATNVSVATPPLNATGIMMSAANIQLLFFADGTHKVYFDPDLDQVLDWTLTAGTFPVDGSGNLPTLICTWRGRTVLSGLQKDPSAWFMSKVSDPFDYNYAPDVPVPPDSAVAGTVAQQGNPSDTITALIPYNDDVLIFGCAHSIFLFRGDPNYGGSIDLVTDAIGIVWGKAWCMDPSGVVYFFSNQSSIFAFVPGNQPTRISEPIDSILLNVNTGEYTIRMEWNDRYKGVHVFVTLTASPFATTHFFYETLSNAWWTDVFANTNMNPIATVAFDGNFMRDRLVLLGGWDGYVRSVDPDATKDDGTAINSEVWIGPFLTKFGDSVILKELQPVMGANSGDVEYSVYVGQTAEQALQSTPVKTGTWSAGRNLTSLIRRAGYAAYVSISASTEWALEEIRAVIETAGKVRRRGKSG